MDYAQYLKGTSMLKFIYLLIGHLIGDSLFSWWLKDAKRRSLFFLGIHSFVYTLVVTIFAYVFINSDIPLWAIGVVFASHFVIDYWKCYILKIDSNLNVDNLRYSILDQVLHLLILAAVIFKI